MPRLDANMMPSEDLAARSYNRFKQSLNRLLILLIVFVVIYSAWTVYDSGTKMRTNRPKVDVTQQMRSRYQSLATEEQKLGDTIATLNSIAAEKRLISNQLRAILTARPQGLWFQNIVITDTEVMVVGVTQNFESVETFILGLKQNRGLETARIASMDETERYIRYKIQTAPTSTSKQGTTKR